MYDLDAKILIKILANQIQNYIYLRGHSRNLSAFFDLPSEGTQGSFLWFLHASPQCRRPLQEDLASPITAGYKDPWGSPWRLAATTKPHSPL